MNALQTIEIVATAVMIGVLLAQWWLAHLARKRADGIWREIGERQAELRPGHDPASVAYIPTYRGCIVDAMGDSELRGLIVVWDDATARCRREDNRLLKVCLVVCIASAAMSVLNFFIGGE